MQGMSGGESGVYGRRGSYGRRWQRRLPALALLVVLVLAGCGESGSPASSSSGGSAAVSGASGLAASTSGSAARANAVASVSGRPIARSSYEHWLSVERALGGGASSSHRALGFLVTSAWLLDEAAARGVSVSAAEVNQRLAALKRQSFSRAGSLQKFLASSHETEADLLGRVKVELLESGIAAKVAPGQSGSQRKATLARFQQTFQRRWKARTTCDAGYVMEDCSEYHGKPENLAATSSTRSSAASSSRAAGHSQASSSAASASGEVYTAPGAMAISSSAFERNGAVPAQYTCDGANISPPLEWQNVPAKAAALVLFVIDDSPTGAASGIRWVVGDIDPHSHGVAAGKTPEGGIVGADTQGHPGYGGICPARGKTSTLEFVLYALSKPISLSPGFAPATAESEYGSGKLLLGSAAVTYAVYHRA
jgi:phosphatidylethanolamine-binding protein (PEBP) family uncharacterized protein